MVQLNLHTLKEISGVEKFCAACVCVSFFQNLGLHPGEALFAQVVWYD